MCAPLAVAAAAMAVKTIGSIADFVSTQSAHHAAVQTANLNFAAKDEQAQRQAAQTDAQQTEQNLTDAVKQAQTFGRVATSASAMGLGQYSTNQLLDTSAAAYNRTLGINDKNYDAARVNIQTELEGASLERSSAIAKAPRTNLGMLALNIAGNAVSAAGTYGDVGGKFGVKPAA